MLHGSPCLLQSEENRIFTAETAGIAEKTKKAQRSPRAQR
jgi:hypothetical protein